jgi:hypothetical protein
MPVYSSSEGNEVDSTWFIIAGILLFLSFVCLACKRNAWATALSALAVAALVAVVATSPVAGSETIIIKPAPTPTPPVVPLVPLDPSIPVPPPANTRFETLTTQRQEAAARRPTTRAAVAPAAAVRAAVPSAPPKAAVRPAETAVHHKPHPVAAKARMMHPPPGADRGESMATMAAADRGEMVRDTPGQAHAVRCGLTQRELADDEYMPACGSGGGGGGAADVLYAVDRVTLPRESVVPDSNGEVLGRPPLSPFEYTPNIPACCPSTPTDDIRNNGLYGVKGDYNCDIMTRATVMDTGFVQPLGAREEWMKYLAYDMPNKRDQFMVRKERGPLLMI